MRKTLVIMLILALVSCAGTTEKNPCKNPEYAKVMKEKARADISRNDFYAALEDTLSAKKCNPKDPEVYYLLGQIYWKWQERDKAKENFTQAIKYNPDYPEAYLALGDMFLQENNLDSALLNYQKAANDDRFPEAFLAWNNIGWIYLQQDRLADAEQALMRSISRAPNFCVAYCNLGEIRSKQKRYEEAIKELKKAIQLCPNLARAHRLLGLEYNRMGKTREACAEFELARKNADPESDEAKSATQYLKLLNCPTANK